MIIGYIKEENLKNSIFSGIEIRRFDNNYVIAVSIKKKDNDRIKRRLIKNIKKLEIDALVFSKELEKRFKPEICEMLQLEMVQILNGKKLMEFMEFEIVKYVLNKQKKHMKQEEIYIIFKKSSNLDLNFLKRFIEGFRIVNIVTNDLERLKNVQDNLLENDGILISVSNNKRKALKRAKYILNINLNKEELEKYRINRDAIIINIQENVKYGESGFDGININYFNIKCPDEYMETFEQIGDNFDLVQIYESILLNDNIQKKKIEDAYERIERDDIKIINLIGNNGIIADEELKKISK